MDSYQLPNRNRWDGWVTFAWAMVGLAIIVGTFLIGTMGTMEIPEQDFRGNISWQEEPNFVVWGAAIGQAVGAAMLAAIFSILNSTYKNSCDLLQSHREGSHVNGEPHEASVSPQTSFGASLGHQTSSASGLVVEQVGKSSPFYQILKPGFAIRTVNGKSIESVEDLKRGVTKGSNDVEFSNQDGKVFARRIKLTPGDLGVEFKA